MGGQGIGVLFLQRPFQAFMAASSQAPLALRSLDQSCEAQDESLFPCQDLISLSQWSKIIPNE